MELQPALDTINKVFGGYKIIKENSMELTTKILAISDKSDKKRSFQIEINGNKEWAAYWYSSNDGDKPMEEINMVKDLRTGDEANFNVFQSGRWWNINSIIPDVQVKGDVQGRPDVRTGNIQEEEDPGPSAFPYGAEKEASKLAETAHPSVRYDNMLIIRQCVIKAVGPIVNGMFIAGANPTAEDAVTIARVLETYVLTGK